MVSTVLHINTADNDGGAARSAYRIHNGLKKLGLTSRMFVRYKVTRDPDIQVTAPLPFLYPMDKAFSLLWTLTGWQYLFYPSSYFLLKRRWYKEADIIQLYNIHGNYFTPAVLPLISKEKPVVWRLSDMWPFTGHCAYSYDCERWKTGCGECPLLKEYPPLKRDTTAFLWKFKKRAYDRSYITLIAPSRWIAKLAEKSPLFNRFSVHYIPNGIDSALFQPVDPSEAKKSWGISPRRKVILLQDMGPGGERKGRTFLSDIIRSLKNKFPGQLTFLVFGAGSSLWKNEPDIVSAGMLRGEKEMARLYSAADLFIFPTRAENLANVALESMVCGVPVISFNEGGMPDLISTNVNGMLVETGHVQQLIDAAGALIADPLKRNALGAAARQTILGEFTRELESRRVLDVYQSAASRFAEEKRA